VPAVGRQVQAPPRAARVLQLERDDSGLVDYTLLHADGSRLQDSSTVMQARAAGLLPGTERPATDALETAVAELVVGTAPDLAHRLAALGVGAVQVPAEAGPELVTTLDLVSGLTRVTEEGPRVWRVEPDGPAPAWATVLAAPPADGPAGEALGTVPADGTVAVGRLDGGAPADRTVVVAEAADPGWHGRLDGRPLPEVEAGGLQAFTVGADAGRLTLEYESPYRGAWLTVAGVVVIVFALLALPVGRRRGRLA
jgi:hypothetical protein